MGIRDQHLFVEDIAAVDLDGNRLTVRWIKGGRSRFRRIVRRKARAMSASLIGIPALCALFVVLWSSGFAGAKYGLDYAGTFTILFWRYLLVATVLAHAGWLAAVLGAIDLGLSAGLAAFITALQPIMTGDGIALGGSPVAYALPFLAVVSITIASLTDRGATVEDEKRSGKVAPLLLITFWHCAASFLALAPLAIGIKGLEADWNGSLVFAIAWLAFVVSLAAYGLMFVLLRRMSAARVASLTYLSPPVTMVMAWLVFGETLTLAGLAGLAVAAIAVGLTLTARRSEPTAH